MLVSNYKKCVQYKVKQQESFLKNQNKSNIKITIIPMSQTPQKHSLDFENDLDHSVEEEQLGAYKRDSGIEQLNFQLDEYHHEPHFNQTEHTDHFTNNSHLSEEGVFSYNDDYRMRQSMKSQEDFELEDISGNADMTDRNGSKQDKNQQQIKIIQKYDENIKSVEQKHQNQQISLETQTKQTKQAIQTTQQSQQCHKIITVDFIKQTDILRPHQSEAQYQEAVKIATPKKQKQQQAQTFVQKQQWSNQSNKSYSPQAEPYIYKQTQSQAIQLKQQSPQKPKISLLKESFTLVKYPDYKDSLGSSIKDWFKPTKPIQTKQYNPSPNQQPSPVKKQDAKQKYRRQMEAQMLGFQQSLTQHQKINKLFGVTEKQKQKHKVNKTHFPQPTSKKYLSTDSQQMGSQEYRMLLKISFEKKKQNYQMLKQWDKRRAENMNVHRNMIQMLQNQIDKRIKASLQNFEIYTNFFKQKLKQQQKFINSPVINTKYALQNNAISKNIYINCSVILNSLSEQNQAKCKKIQDFITLIKNNVIKDLTDQHLHESQRQLLKVRQKISTLKNSLKKYNSETEQKTEELAKLFSQSATNVSIKSASDFYSVQLDFLRCASQQILIQKRLGQNCLEYYHTALNEQFKRAKVIRQALLTYSKGLKETFNIQLQDVGLQQLSKSEQTNLIKEFYSLDDMFDQRSSQILKQKFKIPDNEDLSINHVSKFVENFEFENFNNRMLLLKEFQAKYYSAGGSKDSKSSRQQTCYMVITVDMYIHLFFSCEKTSLSFKPDISLKIIAKELQIRSQKDEFIDIVKKQQKRGSMISYFWDSKNEKAYRIKFGNKDAKQQFCDYVKKLMF